MLDRLLRALALGAGAVLLALMALVLFDVLMRYVLRLPFLGAYELTELAMVLIVFLGLAHCGATGGHVAVDVFAGLLERPGLRWIAGAVHLAGAALLAVIAWRTVLHALESGARGEATNMMRIPHQPFELVAAACTALFAAVLVAQAWRALGRPGASGAGR
jgi:TRAP-type C4-dicarboxylate transport system permease small subunit